MTMPALCCGMVVVVCINSTLGLAMRHLALIVLSLAIKRGAQHMTATKWLCSRLPQGIKTTNERKLGNLG